MLFGKLVHTLALGIATLSTRAPVFRFLPLPPHMSPCLRVPPA